MKIWLVVLALTTLNAGCTTMSLERNTLNQSMSLSSLRYREVMYNLAALANNPDVLPAYAAISAGTTTLTDSGTIDPVTLFGREVLTKGTTAIGTITHFQQETLDVVGSRKVSDNWSLDPVAVPEKLRAMRYACLGVLKGPETLPPEALLLLGRFDENQHMPPGHYFEVADELARLPPGWLHVGRLKDVPRKTVYKAHCGAVWVWVRPDGMEGLTAFTLVIHKIAQTQTDTIFQPQPDVRTITKQVPGLANGPEGSTSIAVTVYVDNNGNLVQDTSSHVAGFPFKKRIDDIGASPYVRSVVTAAGSKSSP